MDYRDTKMEIEEGIKQYLEEKEIFEAIDNQKLITEGRKVADYLMEKGQKRYIYPFFTSWVRAVCEHEGEEKFALPNIKTTLRDKNMVGRIEKNITELLHEGGFEIK